MGVAGQNIGGPRRGQARIAVALGGLIVALAIALFAGPAGAAPGSPGGPDPEAGRPGPPTAARVDALTQRFAATLPPAGARTLRRAPSGSAKPVFGRKPVVALYGAPQLRSTAVGKRSAKGAARKLKKQARAYRKAGKGRVARSIDLIGVIATASAGSDGLYRTRQDDRVIATYLRAARSIGARLVLDIQPGRSTVLKEMRALKKWLRMPDVDVAIDPEWNVGRKGVPGQTEGSIKAGELNRATAWLDDLVAARELPPKGLIVHQFREGSVKGRKRLRQGDDVGVLLNFDGIGAAAAKKAGYKNLSQRGIFNGFSLFYDLDDRLMKPRSVLRLRPRVDYAMYQ